jgi:hypothetical protein
MVGCLCVLVVSIGAIQPQASIPFTIPSKAPPALEYRFGKHSTIPNGGQQIGEPSIFEFSTQIIRQRNKVEVGKVSSISPSGAIQGTLIT